MASGMVSTEQISQWVARRIDRYLIENPHRTLSELATEVGVSPTTVSRWKSGEGNVATEHLHNLLPHLDATLDDLANEVGLGSVTPDQLPRIKVRGARRKKSSPVSVNGDSSRVPRATNPGPAGAGQEGSSSCPIGDLPDRVITLSLRPNGDAPILRRAQQEWKQCFEQATDLSGSVWRLGKKPSAPLIAPSATKSRIDTLLEGLGATVRKDDFVMLHLCGALELEDHQLVLRHSPAQGQLTLQEVADRVHRFACPCLLVLECLWPDESPDGPGPDGGVVREVLAGLVRPGVSLIAATVPSRAETIDGWPFIGQVWREGLVAGNADGHHNQWLTVADLCDYAGDVLQPRNMQALDHLAAGRPATVVPVPRLQHHPNDEEQVVAVHRRHFQSETN